MNKLLLAVILAISVISSAAVSFFAIREYRMTQMRCTTYNTVVLGSQVSSLRFDIAADGEDGVTNIDGFYMDENGTRIPVRAAHAFRLSHTGNLYTFSHQSLGTLSGNEASLEQIKRILPAYMTEPGASVKLMRYRQGKDGFILSSGSVLIYCKKPDENQ